MVKNALLSIRKNLGKTILLFVLMCVIANLVIAGLSIKNATVRSMDQLRASLGNGVTLSYNMKNMMKNRDKGSAIDQSIQSITLQMADQLKDLEYVENYNYCLNVGVSSDDIVPVEVNQNNSDNLDSNASFKEQKVIEGIQESDFTVVGNTTMAYLDNFVNQNYVLTSGRLLTIDDQNTTNCVIETNLASDNDLNVNDMITLVNNDMRLTLCIVGIYEIETSENMNMMMGNRQNPINQIYTDLSVAQQLNNSDSIIDSAIYYLNDPQNIEAFKELAQTSTDIDFENFTLDTNDRTYQQSVSSLQNIEQFSSIFLWIVILAGSVILCLILILTLRSRFYEFGVLLSLGQSKIKIIIQQLCEIGIIALIAFCISLSTGKMVSNIMSSMLETSLNSQPQMVMDMSKRDDVQNLPSRNTDMSLVDRMQNPTNSELDVSLTSQTVLQLAAITTAICLISVIAPSMYILRLSPREILIKKEG